MFTTMFGLPVDAVPFQGDLIVTESATGNVVRASGPELAEREILATLDGPTGLAATGEDLFPDLYVSVAGTGEVIQLIDDGELLPEPVVVASGSTIPEGLTLYGADSLYPSIPATDLLVAEGGTQTLEKIELESGNVTTLATDLGFSPPTPAGAFGWFSNVEIDGLGEILVNADQANVIWKISGTP